MPVPISGENLGHRNETAHRLVRLGLGIEYQLKLFQVFRNLAHATRNAHGERLEESIFHLGRLQKSGVMLRIHSEQSFFGNRERHRVNLTTTHKSNCGWLALIGGKMTAHIGIERAGLAIEGEQRVTRHQSSLLSCTLHAFGESFDNKREPRRNNVAGGVFVVKEHSHHLVGKVDCGILAVAGESNGLGVVEQNINKNLVEIVGGLAIDTLNHIALAESKAITHRIHGDTVFEVVDRHIRIAPIESHHRIYNHCKYGIDDDAGKHYNKALPGGFGAELPRLGVVFEVVGVGGLVYHTGNAHIAAERNPADAVLSLPAFEFEEAEPRIEKQVEFFDPALENFCGDEVSKLVKYNQEAQTHQQLRYFNSDFHF